METKNTHILADFWGCNIAILDDQEALKDHMARAAFEACVTPLAVYGRSFTPQGVTVLVAVEESHLSIHTWPEKGYAALDFFTCGTKCQPRKALDYLREALDPDHANVASIIRGSKGGIGISSVSKAGVCGRSRQ